MKACIVNIGDELLIGQIVNTNASFMASHLSMAGVHVKCILCIADEEAAILDTLTEFSEKYDLLIFTGGLGPTRDDITKEVICRYFNDSLVENQKVLEHVRGFFSRRNLPFTEPNRRQALVPSQAQILDNALGTAPGMLFKKDNCTMCFLPGVPYEMKDLLTKTLIPLLQESNNLRPELHKTILTQGLGESFLAAELNDFEDLLPTDMHLAYLPSPGIVRLRLSLIESSGESAVDSFEEQLRKMKLVIKDYIFGEDEDSLEHVLSRLLEEKKLMLSVAESCTGGYLSSLITSVSGASKWYRGGVIAYNNDLKIHQLGVAADLIEAHGAVSGEVVCAMAEGAAKILQSDCSIAISGIAGPSGGTPDKPVGTIWIAVKTPLGVKAKNFLFTQNRERNIHMAALTAMNILRKELL